MLQKLINQLEDLFANNPEEHNRALSIFSILTHRIRNEIMPDIEKLIGKTIKRFFLPKKLNDDERKILLGILCQLPLYLAFRDIKYIFKNEEEKADAINSHLAAFFFHSFGINFNDLFEFEKKDLGEEQIVWVFGEKISKWLNYPDPIFIVRINELCFEKVCLIEADTIKIFCSCRKEELLTKVRSIVCR